MLKVVAPTIHQDNSERQRQCQRAMEEEFQALTSLAESAGWSWQEIALALMELTEEYVMVMRSNAERAEGALVAPTNLKTLH
ncbi:hypothetical protein PYH37_003977 [Sinorhizobium numidicum]|uniref:Uncharacterized protein n=1 Tax=Sinorhizobium numidicum TaxID=680248 RepID=A0ABY8CUS5_9HYPH|nr:hypothetical protein [Sinorhizobium numidicum]WEX79004.1 hypothetical protein PYH37_003977 [Sinorhizobium numidicum]WEX82400.1 hypothetical protein PYH38_004689 [Sinorhizobium numidicum]